MWAGAHVFTRGSHVCPAPLVKRAILPSPLVCLCSFTRSLGKHTVGVRGTPLRCLPGSLQGGVEVKAQSQWSPLFSPMVHPREVLQPQDRPGVTAIKSGWSNGGSLSLTLGNGKNLMPTSSLWHLVLPPPATLNPAPPHTDTPHTQMYTHTCTRTSVHHTPHMCTCLNTHTHAHLQIHTPTYTHHQTHTQCQNSHPSPGGGTSDLFCLISSFPEILASLCSRPRVHIREGDGRVLIHRLDQRLAYCGLQPFITFLL